MFGNIIARVSTHWSSWWHGGFGSIEIVASLRDLCPVLIPSCMILEIRPSCGVWQEPKGSVAYGHD